MNWDLMWDSVPTLLRGVPVTLQLVGLALLFGAGVAFAVALLRLYGNRVTERLMAAYVFVFRGTPLLVQIFLIYYGMGQFELVRSSFLWVYLREPFWCAILALTLNTGAYTSEILRGAILSVPQGQIEAARACGMSRTLLFRRIMMPVAIRQMLPAYGNEVILMVKASSLASTITLLEITGIARKIIAQSFAVFEVFIVAGSIYLLLNFIASRLIRYAEWRMTPYLRARG
ncbi:ABC transporter permease [Azospirillum baldaniorum]|uniref:Arginine ABC transporter, permease component n=1 Tax=Azospirillum baldaniorum TaxID=1064539 RepID=A0A9P1JMR6_9PROT|nr:ABC transporter permease [Azospirillum baldaniorum]AWJ88676.1 ABC transporter permease [Azospirillum baldaniorum]NUB06610.1 ABC transporter permease [Azospirillum baldaniorum]TWA79787.1 amino acid ABC transporter membrane protein 2 (PAAT family) [Azospirillum brasilense]CCC96352.1 arginine ABC transporter, permease component [Azospirillum baldaniorum]